MKKRNLKILKIFLIVVLVSVVFYVAFGVVKNKPLFSPESSASPESSPQCPDGWTYCAGYWAWYVGGECCEDGVTTCNRGQTGGVFGVSCDPITSEEAMTHKCGVLYDANGNEGVSQSDAVGIGLDCSHTPEDDECLSDESITGRKSPCDFASGDVSCVCDFAGR